MKILSIPSRLSIVFVLINFIIFSCKKEVSDTLSPQDEEQANLVATQSDAEAENVFDGVFNDALGVNADVGLGATGIFGRLSAGNVGAYGIGGRVDNVNQLPACLNLSLDHTSTSPFPVRVTLDFGSAGCVANDGHQHRGKMIIVYTGRLLTPGANATVKFEDYYIDSIRIDNSTAYSVTNTGTVDKPQLTIEVNAKLSKANGNYSEWHSRKVITWIQGYSTASNRLDDVLKIEGEASGKVKRNDVLVAWKAVISEPLIKQFSCPSISKGIVKIARETISTNSQWAGSLDYGYPDGGKCDRFAKLTVNGNSFEITLR